MVTPDYKIKLIDMGYGIPLTGRDGSSILRTPLGTPMYRAPEIVARRSYEGKSVDLFAFGVMLLSVRTMSYPFTVPRQNDRNYARLIHRPN